MLLRRKMWVAVLTAAILFLMLASQSIQRRHLLSLTIAPPTSQATPTRGAGSGESGIELVELTPDPPRTPPPPSVAQPQAGGAEPAMLQGGGVESAVPQAKGVTKAEARRCGCDLCVSELGGSDWFRQRYDPQQQPVLHNTQTKMDTDALAWWLGLQRSNEGQTLEEVMRKLFQVIAPPPTDFKPHPSHCRSCAVVGNSGNLQHSGHGNLIDSHGSVIRMNKAVTRGFEQDVGNRTTHHFLYPESAVDVGRGLSLVLLPFKLRDLEWLTSALSTGHIKMTYMRVKDRVEADKDKVLVVNPVFFNYVHERWTERHGRYPSTGMLAIVFALHICDKVSVFGYGADQQGNWHHYWEENRYAGAFRKTGVHSADFETGVIHRLAQEGKISLHL